MALRTTTYDDATHKIVPIEPTPAMASAAHKETEFYTLAMDIYRIMIAASPTPGDMK